MGPKFAVRDDSVTKHSSNLATSEASMNAQAKRFLAAIEPLQGVWQGTSFGSWEQLTTAWNEAMAGLNKSLADIKGRVGNAGSLYTQYEQDQTDQINSTMAGANFDGATVKI